VPVGHVLDSRPFPERDRLDQALAAKVDIVYLGDSVLESVSGKDSDRRDIARMLDDLLNTRAIALVQHAGYEMDVYESFAEYLAKQPVRPRVLVVPVNLRSFSTQWPYSFERERLRLAWGDLLGVPAYRPLTGLGLVPSPPFASVPGRPESDSWRDAYATPLSPSHPRLRSLRKLVDVCRRAGIRPLVYVTPVDVAQGERRAGAGFRIEVAKNVEICKSAAGMTLVDLSAAEGDSGEFSGGEHLAQGARRRVAEALAAALR
jgi:hypothetical protein